MKPLPWIVLGAAAVGLATVALRAPHQDYVAPRAEDIQAHRAAPRTLPDPIPAGCRVLSIQVEGMCCTGCTGKLYDRLRATPGFVAGSVDFEEGIARVVVGDGADPETFAAALRFDKYEASLRPQ